MMSLLYFLLIGLTAGVIAGLLVRGRGYGLIPDMVIGIIGAIIGGYVLSLFGLQPLTLTGALITSVVGAVVLLTIVKAIKKT